MLEGKGKAALNSQAQQSPPPTQTRVRHPQPSPEDPNSFGVRACLTPCLTPTGTFAELAEAGGCSSGPLKCDSVGLAAPGALARSPHERIPAADHKPPVAFLKARSQGKRSRELEVVPGRFHLARAPLRLRSDTAVPPCKGGPGLESRMFAEPEKLEAWARMLLLLPTCSCQNRIRPRTRPIPKWLKHGHYRIQRESKRAANRKHSKHLGQSNGDKEISELDSD